MSDQWEQEFEKWRNCLLFAALRVKIAAHFASWKEIGQKRQPNPLFSDIKTGNCSNGLEYLGIKARLKRNVVNALCRMLDMETELAAQLSDRNYTGSGHFFLKNSISIFETIDTFHRLCPCNFCTRSGTFIVSFTWTWKEQQMNGGLRITAIGFSEGWK